MTALRLLCIPVLAVAVAGCEPARPVGLAGSPVPLARPAGLVASAPTTSGSSEESLGLTLYYTRLQQRLQSQGLMRVETNGIVTDAETLARDFERIALFSEYVEVGGRYIAQQNRAELRRWERPVRIELHFGASVGAAVRSADRARIASYVARLRRVSGHPIDIVNSGGNYHIFIASVDEQRQLGPQIMAAEPGLSRSTVNEITLLGRNTYCAVYASSSSDRPNSYVSAVAYIRSEHPDLFRLSCFHEEIAQGLGLANDSPEVRPSIFNDDEEFALLTAHDELLLRILYDRRLRVGMTADEARPIVRQIAAELVGGRT